MQHHGIFTRHARRVSSLVDDDGSADRSPQSKHPSSAYPTHHLYYTFIPHRIASYPAPSHPGPLYLTYCIPPQKRLSVGWEEFFASPGVRFAQFFLTTNESNPYNLKAPNERVLRFQEKREANKPASQVLVAPWVVASSKLEATLLGIV